MTRYTVTLARSAVRLLFALTLVMGAFALAVSANDPASAAPTASVLRGGIVINEILIDPNGATYNYDTDGNGTAAETDEFVEIYNLSGSAINIGGLQLWDRDAGNWFTFPSVSLGAGNFAVVVVGVQAGGSLPAVGYAYNAGLGAGVITNNNDNVVLYDPTADEYVQLVYNGDGPHNPPTLYAGFSATATLVGSVEDWGSDVDGVSLVRNPAGDSVIVVHNTVVPELASPGAPTVPGDGGGDGDGVADDDAEPMPGPDMVPIPENAVVGAVLTDTVVYYAPRPDAATGIVIEAGKTLWVYGLDASGAFYKVMLSGKLFWLPAETLGPNYDSVWNGWPLPTDIVE